MRMRYLTSRSHSEYFAIKLVSCNSVGQIWNFKSPPPSISIQVSINSHEILLKLLEFILKSITTDDKISVYFKLLLFINLYQLRKHWKLKSIRQQIFTNISNNLIDLSTINNNFRKSSEDKVWHSNLDIINSR